MTCAGASPLSRQTFGCWRFSVFNAGVRQADAEELRGVLDRHRQIGPRGDRAEKAQQLGLAQSGDRRRLQDDPVRTCLLRRADERGLPVHRRLGDRHRERQAAGRLPAPSTP